MYRLPCAAMAQSSRSTADTILATPSDSFCPDSGFITVTYGFSKKISQLILLITTFFVAAEAGAAEIVTTLPPLAGLVKMLDQASESTCLLTAGSDPHHFQLSPRQVEKLSHASLLVRSSRDDQGWMQLTATTPFVDLWPEIDHAWLSPAEVAKVLPELARALIVAEPDHASTIRMNLSAALKSVSRIEASLAEALAPLKKRGVMMQHPSWRRVFTSYGIPVLDILESERHGHELGPRHLEAALATLKQHRDALLIGDMQHSNRSLQWLSEQRGDKPILYLDGLGNCGEAWPALMQRNIERLGKR